MHASLLERVRVILKADCFLCAAFHSGSHLYSDSVSKYDCFRDSSLVITSHSPSFAACPTRRSGCISRVFRVLCSINGYHSNIPLRASQYVILVQNVKLRF